MLRSCNLCPQIVLLLTYSCSQGIYTRILHALVLMPMLMLMLMPMPMPMLMLMPMPMLVLRLRRRQARAALTRASNTHMQHARGVYLF